MKKTIFRDHMKKQNYSELQQVNSISKVMRRVAYQICRPSKNVKFTGNRKLAKFAKGNRYILNTPDHYRLSIIKSRVVKSKSWYTADQKLLAVSEHIKYLVRDEVELDGQRPNFFNKQNDNVDGQNFARQIAEDRHHFRFIVSPEEGDQINLKNHIRNLMQQVELDLGTEFTWISVIHQNTANPHAHILMKGKRKDGQDLVIRPDYISRGMRARSAHLLTLELGPRSQLSIQQAKKKALLQNRPIAIDYKMMECSNLHQGKFSPFIFKNLEDQKAAAIRLEHLKNLQLVSKPEHWPNNFYQIDANLVERLKDLEAHYDIYKKISRSKLGGVRQYNRTTDSLLGKVIEKGLQNELAGSYYIVVQGVDGYSWYVDLTRYNEAEKLQPGNAVLLTKQTNSLCFEHVSQLPHLAKQEGVTLLDRCIVANINFANNELSQEIKEAVDQRKQRLLEIGLAKKCDDKVLVHKQLFHSLRDRELCSWKNQLSSQGCKILPHTPNRFTGTIKNITKLSGVHYALIENTHGAIIVTVPKKYLANLEIQQKVNIDQGKFKLLQKKLST